METKTFVNLHVHSDVGSIQDSIMTPEDIIVKVKELGMDAVALTDHGSCAGWLQFQKAGKKHNIKTIFGIEGYFVDNVTDIQKNNEEITKLESTIKLLKKDKNPENKFLIKNYEDDINNLKEIRKNLSKYNHLILLAKNFEGLQNIIKIHNEAVIDGFFRYPRFDWKILEKYNNGIIASSACLGSRISKLLTADNISQAKKDLARFQKIFGKENFYLELQLHDIKLQTEVNLKMIELAKATKTEMDITADCHYTDEGMGKTRSLIRQLDKEIEEVNDDGNLNDLYIKNENGMLDAWKKYMIGVPIDILGDAIINTRKISDSIEVFEFDTSLKFPNFESGNLTQEEFLIKKAYEGLEKHGFGNNQKYLQRLEFELDTINTLGFASYFNVVSDMVNEAKKSQPVGLGRGSQAGSLVAYCVGMADVDPIEYNLYFERFLDSRKGVIAPNFGLGKSLDDCIIDFDAITDACNCGESH